MQHFSVFLYFFLTFAGFCRKKSRVSRRCGQSLAAFAQKKGEIFKNRIQEALFSNLSTPTEEVLCPQGSRDFMRSASQHPARKMRNKSGTSMEQTFRVGTEQGSLRPVSGKLLMRMDFPRSKIAHFLQFHNVYIPPKVAF